MLSKEESTSSDSVELVHWSARKALPVPSLQIPYVFPKPIGALWLSPWMVWPDWLSEEMPYEVKSFRYCSAVLLRTTTLLRVTSANYEAITKKNGVLTRSAQYDWYCLDWNKIATAGYQGVDCLSIPDF